MKKSNVMQDFLKPVIVLFCICLVVGALLAVVNSVTAPIVEENARIKAEETRQAVLEGATSFTEVEADLEALGVQSIYVEDSGLGYVITAGYKGYGGDVVVTVGLNNDGEVVGMSVDTSTETSGIGTKASKPEYVENFIGATGNVDGIDTITSATYSSKAVKNGVNAVLNAYAEIGGGK